MASVGGISFPICRGRLKKPRQTVEDFERPGTNGVGFRQRGVKAPESQIETVRDIAGNQLETFSLSCRQLIGTLVTVVDGFGVETQNVYVKNCDIKESAAKTVVGGLSSDSNPIMCTVVWYLRHTGTSL